MVVMPETSPSPIPSRSAYFDGLRATTRSVFAYVIAGTYVGVGALAHDYGFSSLWLAASTLLVWAAPAQVVLISGLGTGGMAVETAMAVTLSAVRLLPMVVALLPVIRTPKTPKLVLALAAHFTAISMWVETLRLAPQMARERRAAFALGVGSGLMFAALVAGAAGYYLAAGLPPILAAALLFLTPLSFLVSVTRNSRTLIERAAFGIGLVMAPTLAYAEVGLEILWTGIVGGTLAYLIHRLWRSRA